MKNNDIDLKVEKYFKILELITTYDVNHKIKCEKIPKIVLYKYCDLYYIEPIVSPPHKIIIDNIHLSGYVIEDLIIKYVHLFYIKFQQIIDKIINNRTPQYLNIKGSIKKCYIVNSEYIMNDNGKITISDHFWSKIDTDTNFLDLFTNKYIEERKIKHQVTSYMYNNYFYFELVELPDLYKLIEELREKIKEIELKKNNKVDMDLEYCKIKPNYIKN